MKAYKSMKYMTAVALAAVVLLSCGGGAAKRTASVTGTSDTAQNKEAGQKQFPVMYDYRVTAIFPHDTRAYTQGLYWHDGYLWEGTGQYGESELRKVEPKTGKVVGSVSLPDEYFGEGIALLDGKIYQLTWLEKKVLVYDAATLKKSGEFTYSGEGWGITTDGRWLYMSDGSSKIYKVDPDGFRKVSAVEVRVGRRPVQYLNELEWIDGRIWANVYTTDEVVVIDPASGRVEGVIDFSGLLQPGDRTPATDVFNGIAYDPDHGHIYVTGKNWPKVFRVEIKEK